MKNFYQKVGLICTGLILSFNSIAQTPSSFEGLTLSSNSYWDGSDMNGTHMTGTFHSSFLDGDGVFVNTYDTAYGLLYASWSQGFAYSNMTDSVTSGLANAYSAKASHGNNNSSNYALAIQDNFNGVYPTIKLTGQSANSVVTGMYVTNTTYAANSMRDGDFAGKKFGSPNDANGNPDGTNGEDWFLLTIKGYTGGTLTTDSVNFYLADFRFSNNALDYIVSDWQYVDLTSLGAVDSVVFTMTSSDVGQFGINTPTYFAFDDFGAQPLGIDYDVTEAKKISLYPNPAVEKINLVAHEMINSILVHDITGRNILEVNSLSSNRYSMNITDLTKGVYTVTITTEIGIQTERFIKH